MNLSWCTPSNITVVLSGPTHSCVLSVVYLPTGSLTTPPSRRGFIYKGCQTKVSVQSKEYQKNQVLPLKNRQDRKSRKAQMKELDNIK